MSEPEIFRVDRNRVRHLRDGAEAYPAMLAALEDAREEVVLEMYWVGDDAVGLRFRDALVACARRGVAVCVIYDAVGSFGLRPTWWAPLCEAGGEVVVHGPVRFWRKHFHLPRLLFRDHRKLLVVDDAIAFVGGINLALPWLGAEEGGLAWRDDAVELRGPIAGVLRDVFRVTWERWGDRGLGGRVPPSLPLSPRLFVLANRVGAHPNPRIGRSYLLALRRAQRSIDIACSYFIPGQRFLRAMRQACKRGVRVRVILPASSDVWLAAVATGHILDRLIQGGVEVYAYGPRMLHSKTAIFDRRFVTIGSHNLDTMSWRFNLECNVVVDDEPFAARVSAAFEDDLAASRRLDLDAWRRRPWAMRLRGLLS